MQTVEHFPGGSSYSRRNVKSAYNFLNHQDSPASEDISICKSPPTYCRSQRGIFTRPISSSESVMRTGFGYQYPVAGLQILYRSRARGHDAKIGFLPRE